MKFNFQLQAVYLRISLFIRINHMLEIDVVLFLLEKSTCHSVDKALLFSLYRSKSNIDTAILTEFSCIKV